MALFDPEDTLPPFVTTPVVLQINLLNSALYAAIPLSENDKLTVTASIVSLIDAQTSMGADILDIQFDVSLYRRVFVWNATLDVQGNCLVI